MRTRTATQQIVNTQQPVNTQAPSRHRARWGVPEINRLHSEYEIKELSVYQIAALHNRTVTAILSKLQSEELIDPTWQNVRGWSDSNEYVLSPTSQTQSQTSFSVLDELMDSSDEESCCEVEDDPNDGDYEPQDDDDEEDNEEEDNEDFIDDYDLRLKVQKLERQMANLYNFIKDNMNLSQSKLNTLQM
jgi:hypothetical protein